VQEKEWGYCVPSVVLVVPVLLFGSTPAFSQRSEWEGKPVRSLFYVPARQPLAPEDLVRLQELKVGSAYSSKDVADTIDRLFATGAYADIQVDVEQQPAGLAVRFLTKSAPFMGHVAVIGKVSDPPSRTSIADAAHFQLGTPFEEEALTAAEKNIRQLFTSNGHYEAEVTVEKNIDPETALV
jgi:outer membrane protein assembly factor BamA